MFRWFKFIVSVITLNALSCFAQSFTDVLFQRQNSCTPILLEEADLTSDTLVFNNLGNIKSKFCGNPSINTCNGEACCSSAEMRFENIFEINQDVDLSIRNTSTYVPRTTLASPPNGLVTPISDLPQINLGSFEDVDLEFTFEKNGQPVQIEWFDITFFDLDTGDENAIEKITVCGIHTFYLHENTLVQFSIDEDTECVHFQSDPTVKGFASNNPLNANDAIDIVERLAVTVRYNMVDSFAVSYSILEGPIGSGRNFLFAGVSFMSPDDCPFEETSIPTASPSILVTAEPTLLPTTRPSKTPTDSPTVNPSRSPVNAPIATPAPTMELTRTGEQTSATEAPSVECERKVVVVKKRTKIFRRRHRGRKQYSGKKDKKCFNSPKFIKHDWKGKWRSDKKNREEPFDPCPVTAYPTGHPSSQRSNYQTEHPSSYPTPHTSDYPTHYPSSYPTQQSSHYPTSYPSSHPTSHPTGYPSQHPSSSHKNTESPSSPTGWPTQYPVEHSWGWGRKRGRRGWGH